MANRRPKHVDLEKLCVAFFKLPNPVVYRMATCYGIVDTSYKLDKDSIEDLKRKVFVGMVGQNKETEIALEVQAFENKH